MRAFLLAALCLLLPSAAWPGEGAALDALVKRAELDAGAIRDMGDGPLVSELDVGDRSTRASFAGLIRIDGDTEVLRRRIMASDGHDVGGEADRSGFFSDPATEADLADLAFDDGDYEVLSECEPASCKFKLTRKGIERIGAIDWTAEDADVRFNELLRCQLVAYVQAYRSEGDSGLIVYADKPEPYSLAGGTRTLLQDLTALRAEAPGLYAYITSHPEGRPAGVSDRIYWSIKSFGYRPTFAVEHILISHEPEFEETETLLVFKTIYLSHYLAARIQVGGLIDGGKAFGVANTYAIMIDRMLFDGKLNGFERKLLGRGLKMDLDKRLRFIRSLASEQEPKLGHDGSTNALIRRYRGQRGGI
jgi:hypothetical protein